MESLSRGPDLRRPDEGSAQEPGPKAGEEKGGERELTRGEKIEGIAIRTFRSDLEAALDMKHAPRLTDWYDQSDKPGIEGLEETLAGAERAVAKLRRVIKLRELVGEGVVNRYQGLDEDQADEDQTKKNQKERSKIWEETLGRFLEDEKVKGEYFEMAEQRVEETQAQEKDN